MPQLRGVTAGEAVAPPTSVNTGDWRIRRTKAPVPRGGGPSGGLYSTGSTHAPRRAVEDDATQEMPGRRAAPSRSAAARPAFEAGALSHLNALYGTALRLTRSQADAEDLVQDTYVKAFRFADRFEPGTNLKAWLFTILHNTDRNRRRDAAREMVEADSERVESAADQADGGTPEQILVRSTLDADLQEALRSLPAAFREAVWLRDVEELSYAEVAHVLDVPIGTVMSRISRGRRLLYERLTSRTGGSGRAGNEGAGSQNRAGGESPGPPRSS